MLKTITPAEMKRVENQVMERTPITGEQLMQRAAKHVANTVDRLIRSQKGYVLCVCGTGNNGGDGMAAMRMLAQDDPAFQGECWVLPGKLSADAVRELDRLRRTNVIIRFVEEELPPVPEKVGCVIDALFGTGLCRNLEGLAQACVGLINQLGVTVVAVDIPSGLNGLDGRVMGEAVRADHTVTFHRPKPGLYLGQGPDYAGEIIVADIGILPEMDDAEGFLVLERQDFSRLLPKRCRVSHKGNYGRVLLWAGSRGMAGAAAIAATAALRTGAGLVTVACPDAVVDIVQVLCPCATCIPLPENVEQAWPLLQDALARCDAVGAGCGLGKSAWAAELLKRLVKEDKPMVLDADALNLLAQEKITAPGAFITPHPAEAARLLECDTASVVADAPAAAFQLGSIYRTVLKGACSVLCADKKMAINPFGTPAMAKGGSGDALTGVMAALLAGRAAGTYAMDDLSLMQTACALHGLAGEAAQQQYGQRGVLATDLCACLGRDFAEKTNVQIGRKDEQQPFLFRSVTVIVEHKKGMRDEKDRSLVYRHNCGYVQEVLEQQNEWQDACILGVDVGVEWFEGDVAAVCSDGERELWIVAPPQLRLTPDQIRRETSWLGKWTTIRCR
ncbi:MAG: NAD(P)H-hydrate dehydratase [Clostridia bacterium]|nr:NAD(P)H-hydrate dehydratase [Clostridia bacterium]